MVLHICRYCRVHDPSDTTDEEHCKETNCKVNRCPIANVPAPKRPQPVEYLYTRRNRNCHCGKSECRNSDWSHTDGEHMITPYREAQETNSYRRKHHHRVPEEGFASNGGKDSERIHN